MYLLSKDGRTDQALQPPATMEESMLLDTRCLFMNAGHADDHLMMLVFPTAAVFLAAETGATYGELLFLSTAGFIAFGACPLPAGWLADRWSRERLLAPFSTSIRPATASTGFPVEPTNIAAGLLPVGLSAPTPHPVGLALVDQGVRAVGKTLGIRGVGGQR